MRVCWLYTYALQKYFVWNNVLYVAYTEKFHWGALVVIYIKERSLIASWQVQFTFLFPSEQLTFLYHEMLKLFFNGKVELNKSIQY